jgi:Acetyltransferases, including N-acetylases of ribosomal proteins
MTDLANWTSKKSPGPVTLDGRYVRLEPLTSARHSEDLFEATRDKELWRYLPDTYREDSREFEHWFEELRDRFNFTFYAIVNKETQRAEGLFALMRSDPANGVTEIGVVIWGPKLSRSRKATEAVYLIMHYVFEELGYRRFEWKCDNRNEPSKSSAQRFGFTYEGLFRQHQIVKGHNRDTAWYSIIDSEWPAIKAAFETWLSPENFDADGKQKRRLADIRSS